jgi:adenylate kinase
MASGSELGKEISAVINRGDLISDEMMLSILKKAVSAIQGSIIFDGFPRTVAQAQALDDMMKRLQREITQVVMISLPESEVVGRISSRRQCRNCGEILHVGPEGGTVCPVCAGELYTRPDDTPARAKHRLDVYHKDTLPVKNYYQNSGKYVEINGNQTPDQVFKDICTVLEKVK